VSTAVQAGGDWYNKLGVRRTFPVAVDACASSGGQLAVIYDQASHDAIYELIGNQFFKIKVQEPILHNFF